MSSFQTEFKFDFAGKFAAGLSFQVTCSSSTNRYKDDDDDFNAWYTSRLIFTTAMDMDGEVLDWGAEDDDHIGKSYRKFNFTFSLT